jgi:simple sugar transport system permease protein
MNSFLHITFAVVAAGLAGAAWAGIAGILKATVGAHEVITTIMLNWIALYTGLYLFGQGGPLQNTEQVFSPTSNEVVEGARLPVFWGDPLLQGLHIGLFLAFGALVAFWIIISRTTLGYEVRAVGFNPEAARYGGISVARNYFLAMAIAGVFAGLAGAVDMLGWRYSIGFSDIQTSSIGFVGIAVALLGRNTALGVGLSALVFGALVNGTATRNIPPDAFEIPEQAGNLSLTIQALVLLFIGADILILYLWSKAGQRIGVGRRSPV